MAPEILHPTKFGLEKEVSSKEGDVYALGMTVYQVLTGQIPFHPKREFEVIFAVVDGERPPKPENAEEIGMTETVWELLGECWKEDRVERPIVSEILRNFCDIVGERNTIDLAQPDISGYWGSAGSEDASPLETSTTCPCGCESPMLVVQIVVIR